MSDIVIVSFKFYSDRKFGKFWWGDKEVFFHLSAGRTVSSAHAAPTFNPPMRFWISDRDLVNAGSNAKFMCEVGENDRGLYAINWAYLDDWYNAQCAIDNRIYKVVERRDTYNYVRVPSQTVFEGPLSVMLALHPLPTEKPTFYNDALIEKWEHPSKRYTVYHTFSYMDSGGSVYKTCQDPRPLALELKKRQLTSQLA